MALENGEGSPNPDKNRSEIDRIKGLVKADNLIFRGHDYDNPGENELDGKEEQLIKSFGLEKVETVQQLFDSISDPNRGHEIPKEKLDILATAFYESIVESGRKEIVVAGSSSIEKQLSWAGFSGRDKKNEENPSFAFMVAEKFRSNFGTEEKRNEITTTMEYLDFVKNSEYSKNGGLEEAAGQAYDNLKKIKPNVLNKKEMEAYAEVLRYVSKLRRVENKSNGENKGTEELKESIKQLNETVANLSKPRKEKPLDYDNLDINELNARNLEIPDIRPGHEKEDIEKQRNLARVYLDYVQFKHIFSTDTISSEIDFLKKLQTSSKCEKNVSLEIKYRLELNDMAMCAMLGDGKLGESIGRDNKGSIDYIANDLGEGNGVTKDFIEFLFVIGKYKGENPHGFEIAESWDMLQEAGLNYKKMVDNAVKKDLLGLCSGKFTERGLKPFEDPKDESEKLYNEWFKKYGNYGDVGILIKPFENPKDESEKLYNEWFKRYGEVRYNWFWDGNPDRKKFMQDYMISELMNKGREKNTFFTKEMAEKSFELTVQIYYATGEDQYLNEDFVGTADMAKMFKIGILRKIDGPKGKKGGPIETMNGIDSCGMSYMRMTANKDCFDNIGEKKAIGQQEKLMTKDIKPENMGGKFSYYFWGTALNINKLKVASSAYMSRKFDYDELTDPENLSIKLDAFNKMIDYVPNALTNPCRQYSGPKLNPTNKEKIAFIKTENKKRARAWYVMGQMENALRSGSKLDINGLAGLYYNLVAYKGLAILEKTDSGVDVITGYTSFIPQKAWDVIMKELDVYNKLKVKGKLVKRFTGKT